MRIRDHPLREAAVAAPVYVLVGNLLGVAILPGVAIEFAFHPLFWLSVGTFTCVALLGTWVALKRGVPHRGGR